MSSPSAETPLSPSEYVHNYNNNLKRFQADFLSLGFDKVELHRLIRQGDIDAANDLLAGSLPKLGKGRKSRYQHVRLYKKTDKRNKSKKSILDKHLSFAPTGSSSPDWVLFDPHKDVPQCINHCDLPLLIKLALYQPGNQRYLESNIKMSNIRVHLVRRNFAGMRVRYTPNGPLFVPVRWRVIRNSLSWNQMQHKPFLD